MILTHFGGGLYYGWYHRRLNMCLIEGGRDIGGLDELCEHRGGQGASPRHGYCRGKEHCGRDHRQTRLRVTLLGARIEASSHWLLVQAS